MLLPNCAVLPFLNCLKSMYHMLENGEKQRMQMMIIAFSNHLRYIFRDSMQEVTLAEELQEVMDYHRIISLDTAVPLLLTTHVPDALLDGDGMRLIEVVRELVENGFFDGEGPDFSDVLPQYGVNDTPECVIYENRVMVVK